MLSRVLRKCHHFSLVSRTWGVVGLKRESLSPRLFFRVIDEIETGVIGVVIVIDNVGKGLKMGLKTVG